MPSLMQSGNLPFVSKNKKIIFSFYTKVDYIDIIDTKFRVSGCKYDFKINCESNYDSARHSIMLGFLINVLEDCVKNNALMLLAQPDLFYSNNSIKNLIALSENKGVSIAIPHPRVSYECIENIGTLSDCLNKEVDDEILVKSAISCKHKSFKLSDESLDENITMNGISTNEIDVNHISVVHNLPSVYLFSPIKSDITYFRRRTTFNYVDTTWPHMLLRQSRLKVVASSKIAFVVELTKDHDKITKPRYGMKNNDQYIDGVRPFCNYSNAIINSWESSK